MRLKSQDEILDPGVRSKIIDEIEATENKKRKDQAFRRWQVYKDKTSTFVVDLLLEQFKEDTVKEMSYSITNVSLVRKIINKLSRVYMDGVSRSISDDEDNTLKISQLEDILDFNAKMKTQNRMLKLQKNTIAYIKPCPFFDDEGNELMRVRVSPLNPYLYDVVEDFYDRTRPMAYVLNNYQPGTLLHTNLDPANVRFDQLGSKASMAGQLSPHGTGGIGFGNRKDEKIADKKEDEQSLSGSQNKEYIWWTKKYHFTTNSKGTIIDRFGDPIDFDEEAVLNPIDEIPIVNFSIDQDNSFWAEGGEDLVDSGIVINSLLTQANHIAVIQGYGQFFMTGKNLPQSVPVGPATAIKLEYDKEEDPQPQIGFANANPPLQELMDLTLSQVALTLTMNDLSTSGVSAQLDSGSAFPSGIAMMIDKAESMEDVEDQRSIFSDAEKKIWPIVGKFLQKFSEDNVLDPELEELLLPEEFDLQIEFGSPKGVSTEREKLENLKLRKDLGLNTEVELIQLDQPGLDEEQALAKLQKIKDEKKLRMQDFGPGLISSDDDSDNIQEDQEDDENDQNQRDGEQDE